MMVRLGFAVAAFLDPEILVVDEVLAVGDVEFQKKCIGKMKEVAGSGRTILFVSHNLSAVSNLCDRIILIENGTIIFNGDVESGIKNYINIGKVITGCANLINMKKNREGPRNFGRLTQISTYNENRELSDSIKMGSKVFVEIQFQLFENVRNCEIGFAFSNHYDIAFGGFVNNWEGFESNFDKGVHKVLVEISYMYLMPGKYLISAWLKRRGERVDDQVSGALQIEVLDYNFTGHDTYFAKYQHLGIFTRSNWKFT
jgi:lipopolysaccharide transport system ATP-binding protein